MAIRVTCSSCDKKLSVRDELAGKKIKCPGCGTVFVAAAEASTGIKAGSAKANPPPSAKDKVSAKPMAKRPAPPPIDDDDDDDMDERPVRGKGRKASSGSGSKLWLWLSLAAVLVIGGGVGGYFAFFYNPPTNTGPIVKGGPPAQPPVPAPPPADGGAKPQPVPIPGPVAGSSALTDLVPGDALLFVSFNNELYSAKALDSIRPLLGKDLEGEFGKAMGFAFADVERVVMINIGTFAELAQNKEDGFVAFIQSKRPLDQAKVRSAMQTSALAKNPNLVVEFIGSQTIAVTPKAGWQAYTAKKGKTKATGALERGLAMAAASKGVVAVVNVPPEAIQLAEQALKDAPPFFAPFLKTKSVLASLDLADKLNLKASLIMENEAAATDAKKAADGLVGFAGLMLGGMAKDPQMADLVNLAQQALKDLKIAATGDDLSLAFEADVGQLAEKVMPIIMKIQGAAGIAQEANNLKQIGLAWHNYHDTNKMLPPQTVGKGLSWRVAILPYIEEVNLYRQFKLDEPWDSEHNKKLIPLMPKTYESVSRKAKPGFTFYQTFVGPNTINKDVLKGMKLATIPDGSANTLLVGEAAEAVEWTRPADIQVTPNQPITLGSGDGKSTLMLMGDASVRRVPLTIDQKVLRNLIDPKDGNIIPNLDGGAAFEPGAKFPQAALPIEAKGQALPFPQLPPAVKTAGKALPAPKVVKIARGIRADLGGGQTLFANLKEHNVVVLKLEGLPPTVKGLEILRGATYISGNAKGTFNTVLGDPPSAVWVGGAVPGDAKSMTITLPGNIAPFTVDLPAKVEDEVNAYD